jgi:hypothetical protein
MKRSLMSETNGWSLSEVIAALGRKLCEHADLILETYRDHNDKQWLEKETVQQDTPLHDHNERW